MASWMTPQNIGPLEIIKQESYIPKAKPQAIGLERSGRRKYLDE